MLIIWIRMKSILHCRLLQLLCTLDGVETTVTYFTQGAVKRRDIAGGAQMFTKIRSNY